jgi:hypothetical protein
MAKAKKNNEVQEVTNTSVSLEETVSTLKAQSKEYMERSEYFKTMSIKAQGALEVLVQLGEPKDDEGD